VYSGVISDHRKAQDTVAEIDPVTEDMLIGQLAELEKFHWFVRAHLENAGGELSTEGAGGERDAADQAGAANDLNT
jgi:starvation-inducible DNA-binding protein